MDYKTKDNTFKVRSVLMINLHSSLNAGDAALTVVAIDQLKAAFPNAKIILAMNDPASHTGPEQAVGSFMTWLRKPGQTSPIQWSWSVALPWLLIRVLIPLILHRLLGKTLFVFLNQDQKTLLRSYFQADIVVSCAGNFLYSSGRIGVPFFVAIFSIAYAWLVGNPLYMMPQTIGPLHRKWERWLTAWILSRIRLALVREQISRQVVLSLGIPGDHCFYVPDIAFALSATSKTEAEQFLATYGISTAKRPLLGITVINWGAQNRKFVSQSRYEGAVVFAIRRFIDRHKGTVVLFSQVIGPTQPEDDRIAAKRVLDLLTDLAGRVVLIEKKCFPQLLKSMYGRMDLFIGTRMHSNIFALSEKVPVVAIEYFYKTRGIMQSLGLEQWVIDIRAIDARQLDEIVEKAWTQRGEIRDSLHDRLPQVICQASQAGAMIAKHYESLE